MSMPPREEIIFRHAELIFKNFAGEKRQYNNAGDRNFSLRLNHELAMEMRERHGLNVKELRRKDEDEEQFYHLKVKVAFENRPPRCWLITNAGTQRTLLGEQLIDMFDDIEAVRVDLTIAPYDWDVNGNTGRTAYLQSMFYHMYEDPLELEYAHVPQVPSGSHGPAAEIEAGPDTAARQPYDYKGDVVASH